MLQCCTRSKKKADKTNVPSLFSCIRLLLYLPAVPQLLLLAFSESFLDNTTSARLYFLTVAPLQKASFESNGITGGGEESGG